MGRALGLRAGKNEVNWVVLEGSAAQPAIVGSGAVKIPKAYGLADGLRHVREHVAQLIDEHGPQRVVLKEMEANVRPNRSQWPRLRLEGVCIEAAQTANTSPEALAWPSIAARIGAESSKSEYASNDTLRGMDISTLNAESKEALWAAVAGLEES